MQTNKEILIDYLDDQLNQQDTDQVEIMVQNDKSLAGELQYLKLAIDTVRLDAINEKVLVIRRSLTNTSVIAGKPANSVVRSMYKMSLRAAAILILIAGMAVMYKYITVSNLSIYEKQFTGYELSNLRGQESRDAEAEAYQNKNWSEVVTIYKKGNNKSNKSVFLAAMAEMQLNNFPQAVTLFENILNTNSNTGDDSFREETEYYLSLAYLMNHEENKSTLLLNKIKADTSHTYYPLASKLSSIDLKIIELKK
jgi:tetratricopeptide (TPR) repeat protein